MVLCAAVAAVLAASDSPACVVRPSVSTLSVQPPQSARVCADTAPRAAADGDVASGAVAGGGRALRARVFVPAGLRVLDAGPPYAAAVSPAHWMRACHRCCRAAAAPQPPGTSSSSSSSRAPPAPAPPPSDTLSPPPPLSPSGWLWCAQCRRILYCSALCESRDAAVHLGAGECARLRRSPLDFSTGALRPTPPARARCECCCNAGGGCGCGCAHGGADTTSRRRGARRNSEEECACATCACACWPDGEACGAVLSPLCCTLARLVLRLLCLADYERRCGGRVPWAHRFEEVLDLVSNVSVFRASLGAAAREADYRTVRAALAPSFAGEECFAPWLRFGFLLELLLRIECNAFGLWDTHSRVLACGLFPTASLINHSCTPNCVFVREGESLALHAFRDIEEGEEVTVSYVSLEQEVEARRKTLLDSYFFVCLCASCSDPTGVEHERFALKFLCGTDNCPGILYPVRDGFKMLGRRCNNCERTFAAA